MISDIIKSLNISVSNLNVFKFNADLNIKTLNEFLNILPVFQKIQSHPSLF